MLGDMQGEGQFLSDGLYLFPLCLQFGNVKGTANQPIVVFMSEDILGDHERVFLAVSHDEFLDSLVWAFFRE